MGEGEVASFLAEPHKLQLGTIGPDGVPHLVSMYYALFGGAIGFWTYRASQKARNLQRDPRVSCLVETGEGYDQLRGVLVRGTVTASDDPDEVERVGTAVYGRYLGSLEGLEPYLQQQARKRTAFLVHAERVASWDHRKLGVAA